MQRKASVAAEQTLSCKKRVKYCYRSISQKRSKTPEVGPGCTRLSRSSMRRIQWPFHSNTSYTLEAERLVLEKFGLNDIFVVCKKLKKPEEEYFHPPRGAGSSTGAIPASRGWG